MALAYSHYFHFTLFLLCFSSMHAPCTISPCPLFSPNAFIETCTFNPLDYLCFFQSFILIHSLVHEESIRYDVHEYKSIGTIWNFRFLYGTKFNTSLTNIEAKFN